MSSWQKNSKLSFIVPVYGVELYLRKCVDSLLRQNYENYEIILVDDGSNDACPAICDEYAALHERITVIHRENGGLSAARNTGIAAAKGDYVCFVDSDDFWEENVLGELMEQVEQEQLEVLRFDFQNVRIQNGQYEVFEPYKQHHPVDYNAEVVTGLEYLNHRMWYQTYAWQWILSIDMAKQELFTEHIHFEDVDWTPRMMLRARRVNSTPTVVYNYLLREGGITGTKGVEKKKKNIEDQYIVLQGLNRLYAEHSDCIWLRNMMSSLTSGILTSASGISFLLASEYIRKLKAEGVFPLRIDNQGRTFARRAKLTNINPYLYCLVSRISRMIR